MLSKIFIKQLTQVTENRKHHRPDSYTFNQRSYIKRMKWNFILSFFVLKLFFSPRREFSPRFVSCGIITRNFFPGFHIQRLNLVDIAHVSGRESSLPHSPPILPWGAHRVFTSSCRSFVLVEWAGSGGPIFPPTALVPKICVCVNSLLRGLPCYTIDW